VRTGSHSVLDGEEGGAEDEGTGSKSLNANSLAKDGEEGVAEEGGIVSKSSNAISLEKLGDRKGEFVEPICEPFPSTSIA